MAKKAHVDFKKPKIKVGKKLPKNLNVTQINMKVKKVVVPDQICQFEDKDNLKLIDAIISKIDAQKACVKYDTLFSLKSILKSNEENCRYLLDNYQNNVLNLFKLDERKSVQLVYDIIEIIITKNSNLFTGHFLTSFWSVLRMSFTHINNGIREFSINFFLKYYYIFSTLFENFQFKRISDLIDDFISNNFISFNSIEHKKFSQLFCILSHFLPSIKEKKNKESKINIASFNFNENLNKSTFIAFSDRVIDIINKYLKTITLNSLDWNSDVYGSIFNLSLLIKSLSQHNIIHC
ncbi:hypothetical protein MXB_1977, partial [Myxobolus squamalis]